MNPVESLVYAYVFPVGAAITIMLFEIFFRVKGRRPTTPAVKNDEDIPTD